MTKYQLIEFQISGIKCDNELCNYDNPNVSLADYTAWVNKPCPKCGSNLLTEKDYKTVCSFVVLAHKINKWANKLLPEFVLRRLTKNKTVKDIEMNGSGKLNIKKNG